MPKHIALYGNVGLVRMFCTKCKSFTIVISGKKLCCDGKTSGRAKKVRRMSTSAIIRKRPPKTEQNSLLDLYEGKCAYCEQVIGSYVIYHGKDKQLKLNWDHQVPWVYSQDNRPSNFVPSCDVCNRWKSCLMFNTREEVMLYVQPRWEVERVSRKRVRRVRKIVQAEKKLDEVLQPVLPVDKLEQSTPTS